MRLRSARRKSWADVVDRDVEQRSRTDAISSAPGGEATLECRVLPIDFIACLPPANAHLEFCNQMRCFLRIGR
jgi:hypothetical protein